MPSTSHTRSTSSGTLYIVSTPIGNLEDITLRALRVLKSVDLIAAENVRHTRGLCGHYGIKARLTSYNQHNHSAKGPELIGRMRSGGDVALVTNAGTPGVSDPGVLLINQALEEGIQVSPIPGPSAAIAALSVSGLRSDKFLFLGFLSNRSGKRRRDLKSLVSEPRTMVFFEAPHRVRAMLMDLMETLGDRKVVLLREMTKVYEEAKRGSVSKVLEKLNGGNLRGEFTLVVAGKEKKRDDQKIDEKMKKRIEKLLKEKNMSVKNTAQQLSGEEGLAYRKLYRECLTIKRSLESTLTS